MIDRSGRHFGTILNYLRDGSVSLPESQRELEEVLSEARYYLIQGLVEDCQLALQVNKPLAEEPGAIHAPLSLKLFEVTEIGQILTSNRNVVHNSPLFSAQQKSEAYDPLCHIPMVTSPKEEQQIISSCSKVKRL